MARSAKRPKKPAHMVLARNGAVALGGMISRNPVTVGGTTAFLVALSFVSANALWYQPHFHSGAFFSTRDQGYAYVAPEFGAAMAGLDEDEAETTIRIERPEHLPQPKPDPVVEQVQGILRDLDFYGGTVDGITGPATRTAIANYRKKVGLSASEAIDDALLTQLGARQTTSAISATPAPAPRGNVAHPVAVPGSPASDPLILKIQAGLKAFGNDGMDVDGVIGAKTKSAIREFQSLFGLPVTGEPDEVVYAKMREIGLTN